jgi:hypothetical protein
MFGKNTSLWTCSGVAAYTAIPLHVELLMIINKIAAFSYMMHGHTNIKGKDHLTDQWPVLYQHVIRTVNAEVNFLQFQKDFSVLCNIYTTKLFT